MDHTHPSPRQNAGSRCPCLGERPGRAGRQPRHAGAGRAAAQPDAGAPTLPPEPLRGAVVVPGHGEGHGSWEWKREDVLNMLEMMISNILYRVRST
jgi:hypothetical protein